MKNKAFIRGNKYLVSKNGNTVVPGSILTMSNNSYRVIGLHYTTEDIEEACIIVHPLGSKHSVKLSFNIGVFNLKWKRLPDELPLMRFIYFSSDASGKLTISEIAEIQPSRNSNGKLSANAQWQLDEMIKWLIDTKGVVKVELSPR